MDLNGTSDPYCVLKFVDHRGAPVSPKYYRTKTSKMTLNPMWDEQIVFDSDFGFLEATYAHIEVSQVVVVGWVCIIVIRRYGIETS